jgi:hypothetical protein
MTANASPARDTSQKITSQSYGMAKRYAEDAFY